MKVEFCEDDADSLLMAEKGNEFWKTLRLFMVLAALLGGAWFFFWRPAETVTRTAFDKLGSVLEKVTGQKTTIIAGKAQVHKVSDVSELTLVKVRMSTVRTMEDEKFAFNLVPLGKKRLQVSGTFIVSAGYDLTKGGELRMGQNGATAIAAFPDPEILSVELVDLQTLNAESGWNNKLTDSDRDQIIKVLRQQMKQEANQSGLKELSSQYLETRLKDLLGVESVQMKQLQ